MEAGVKEGLLAWIRDNSTRSRGGCLIPDSSKDDTEYGHRWFGGKEWRTHRLVFFLAHGWVSPIVHHTCEIPACIEERHLEPVASEQEHRDRHRKTVKLLTETLVLKTSTNPVTRVRNSTGLTLAQASTQAGCHLQAFFLQECGVYPHILPAIAEWLKGNDCYLPAVEEDYHAYQLEKRRAAGEEFAFSLYESWPPGANAFVGFRDSLPLSRMGFAKRFCVHPGLLYRVETGISQTLPDQLASALRDAGLPERVIKELQYRTREAA